MKELAINKLELLLKDLKLDREKELKDGKNYFNNSLIAVRINEIYKILKGDNNENQL